MPCIGGGVLGSILYINIEKEYIYIYIYISWSSIYNGVVHGVGGFIYVGGVEKFRRAQYVRWFAAGGARALSLFRNIHDFMNSLKIIIQSLRAFRLPNPFGTCRLLGVQHTQSKQRNQDMPRSQCKREWNFYV